MWSQWWQYFSKNLGEVVLPHLPPLRCTLHDDDEVIWFCSWEQEVCTELLTISSLSPFSTMADNTSKPTKHVNKTPPKSPADPTKEKAAKRLSCESNSSHEGAIAPELSALEEAFRKFAIHGDTRATGKEMHGKNWSKLCKDCHVIDGKNVTLTDVDIVFSKIK